MNELPHWTTLNPRDPPGLSELRGAGRVVGIVATSGAHEAGWAVGTAAAAAGAWSAGGIRLILVDGSLSDPKLHAEVGIENGEGVSDALVFGSSIRRVARRVEGEGYFAVAAGTAVADAAQAMSGGRWAHLCAGFRDAGVTLAVYLNGDDPAAAVALEQASHVLVVAGEGESVPSVVEQSSATVLGVVGATDAGAEPDAEPAEDFAADLEPEPAADFEADLDAEPAEDFAADLAPEPVADFEADLNAEPEEDLAADLEPEPEVDFGADVDAELTEDFAADLEPEPAADFGADVDAELTEDFAADLEPEPGVAAEAAPQSDPPDETLPEPELIEGEEEIFSRALEGNEDSVGEVAPLDEILEESEGVAPSSGRRNGLLLVLLLVIAGALAAGWFGLVEIPGITPTGGSASTVPQPTQPVAVSPPVERASVQSFSVVLGAFGDPAAAQAVVDGLRPAYPGLLFLVEPLDVDGRTLHRALAGPASDSAEAALLLETLAATDGAQASGWALRETPLTFQLGEMADLAAAQRRAEVLAGMEVPAYVMAVDYSDGTVLYRVYAGAFTDEAEATAMRDLLIERGLSASNLSQRKGRLP